MARSALFDRLPSAQERPIARTQRPHQDCPAPPGPQRGRSRASASRVDLDGGAAQGPNARWGASPCRARLGTRRPHRRGGPGNRRSIGLPFHARGAGRAGPPSTPCRSAQGILVVAQRASSRPLELFKVEVGLPQSGGTLGNGQARSAAAGGCETRCGAPGEGTSRKSPVR